MISACLQCALAVPRLAKDQNISARLKHNAQNWFCWCHLSHVALRALVHEERHVVQNIGINFRLGISAPANGWRIPSKPGNGPRSKQRAGMAIARPDDLCAVSAMDPRNGDAMGRLRPRGCGERGGGFGCCRQRNNLIFRRPRDPAPAIGHCETHRCAEKELPPRNRGLRIRSLDAPATRLIAPRSPD